MAHYSYHQKVHLVVDFLIGMRLPETYAALADSGWSAEKLERGWRLLEQAGRARFSEELITADRTDEELNAFKKRWFSVVRIVLGKKSPRLAARLVGELEVRRQAIASFLVEPFLNVLSQFEASSDPAEREARELLRERGLTDEVAREAARLVERTRKVIVTRPADSFLEAELRAEEELWDFYLEWSSLARRAIPNRLLLRRLQWTVSGLPGSEHDFEEYFVNDAVADSSGVSIGGGAIADDGTYPFVARFDWTGALVFVTLDTPSLKRPDGQVGGLTVVPDGILATGGTTTNLAGTHSGEEDVFVLKLSQTGSVLAQFQFGGPDSERGNAITVGLDGRVYVGGMTNGPLFGAPLGEFDAFTTVVDLD